MDIIHELEPLVSHDLLSLCIVYLWTETQNGSAFYNMYIEHQRSG